jgi:soluble lytic murein transglycosylase-like protein
MFILSLFFVNGSLGGFEDNAIKNYEKQKIKREMYLKNLIQQIEIESEVIIPDYIDIKYVEYMYDLAHELELPTRMVFRLVYKESGFIDKIISPKGAEGFFQVMPNTCELYVKTLQVDTLKLDDNQKNIYIGMHVLKDLYDYWISKGKPDSYSWKLSLACYNAGITKVLYYHGIPPYDETIRYIRFILKEHSITTDLSSNNYLTNK